MNKLIPLIFSVLVALPSTSCKSQPLKPAKEQKTENTEPNGVQIEHLTAASFKSKIFDYTSKEYKFAGDKPCIIDFYATWCGPCKMMAPTLQTIAEDYKGKITVYKVDVDAQKELAAAFGISSIPSLLFCPKYGKPQMAAGLLSKVELDKAITDVLLK